MLPLTWLERRWTCDARKTRWISTSQYVDDLVDPTHRSPEYHCHPNHLGLIHVVIQRPLEVSLQDQCTNLQLWMTREDLSSSEGWP
jgi:hypothetical protein